MEKHNRGVVAQRKACELVDVACRRPLLLDLVYAEPDAAICRLASGDGEASYDAVQLELRLLRWVLLFCGVMAMDMEELRYSQQH